MLLDAWSQIMPGQHCEADQVAFENPRNPFLVLSWSFLSIYSTSSFRGLACHLLFTSSTAQQLGLHPIHISELLFNSWTGSTSAWGLFPWAFSGFQSNTAGHRTNFYQPQTNDRQQLTISWINTPFSLELSAESLRWVLHCIPQGPSNKRSCC